jgi:hypothetical protein
MGDKEEKKGWYLGKYARGGSKSQSVEEIPKTVESDTKEKWYPGKLAAKAVRRSSTASVTDRPHSSESRLFDPKDGIISEEDENEKLIEESLDNTRLPRKTLKPQFDLYQTVASVRIRIPSIKYLNLTSASFLIELEDLAAYFEFKNENYQEFDKVFEVKDLSSDIVISISGYPTVNETGVENVSDSAGVVIIPLTSCLSFGGIYSSFLLLYLFKLTLNSTLFRSTNTIKRNLASNYAGL